MKTIEEKAKAYDEARERFKAFKEKYYTKDTVIGDAIFDKTGRMQKDFEQIFPDLKESEDERIRAVILKLVLGMRDEIFTTADKLVTKPKVLAWLEKQKESLHIPESCKENADSFTSKDEKIRKGLIRHLKELRDWKCDTMPPIKVPSHYDAWIAYLERQKEHAEGDFARGYDSGYEACLNSHGAEWFEKQKEQKPIQTDAEKEYVRTLKSLVADFVRANNYIERGYYQQIYDWLDGRHVEQEEQKPAMSREEILHQLFQNGSITLSDYLYLTEEQKPAEKQDYSGLTDFERAIHRGFLCAGVENVPITIIKETAQECMAKIKPAEWSEEDERVYQIILNEYRQMYEHRSTYLSRDDIVSGYNFLKSLRPSWKPSEEQIQAITYLASSIPPNFLKEQEYTMRLVDEVISNLKKL